MAKIIKCKKLDDMSLSSIVAGVEPGDYGCAKVDGVCKPGAADGYCYETDWGCGSTEPEK